VAGELLLKGCDTEHGRPVHLQVHSAANDRWGLPASLPAAAAPSAAAAAAAHAVAVAVVIGGGCVTAAWRSVGLLQRLRRRWFCGPTHSIGFGAEVWAPGLLFLYLSRMRNLTGSSFFAKQRQNIKPNKFFFGSHYFEMRRPAFS
jgi:hypothetical protein